MSRRKDLESNIQESYRLIHEYEQILREVDWPEDRRRAQRMIQQQWELIDEHLVEYRALVGENMPSEMAEIAVSAQARRAAASREQQADQDGGCRVVESPVIEPPAREEQAQADATGWGERKKWLWSLLPEPILIPAGPFGMGSDPTQDPDADANEQPQHPVSLSSFYISRTPITNAQFAAFVQAAGYCTTAEQQGWAFAWTGSRWDQTPGADWQHPRGPQTNLQGKANHPVVQVSWHDAIAFCRWVNDQWQVGNEALPRLSVGLPTEAEWEKAAGWDVGANPGGCPHKRIYPWGDELPDATRCNFAMNMGDTTPVGWYPAGASPYGLLDCAGNVWEWTISLYKTYPYQSNDGRENVTAAGTRVLRGGSWFSPPAHMRVACRIHVAPDSCFGRFGFRCVLRPIRPSENEQTARDSSR